MLITLELYDTEYSIESDANDYNSKELQEYFDRLLVAAGFSPAVIRFEEGGEYQYVSEDEVVVKKVDEDDN